MTPLAEALLSLLQNEAGHLPLSAESLSRVLWVTGGDDAGQPRTVAEIDAACGELMTAGLVERVTTRKIGPRYRAMPQTGKSDKLSHSDSPPSDPARPAAPRATIAGGAATLTPGDER